MGSSNKYFRVSKAIQIYLTHILVPQYFNIINSSKFFLSVRGHICILTSTSTSRSTQASTNQPFIFSVPPDSNLQHLLCAPHQRNNEHRECPDSSTQHQAYNKNQYKAKFLYGLQLSTCLSPITQQSSFHGGTLTFFVRLQLDYFTWHGISQLLKNAITNKSVGQNHFHYNTPF